MIFTPEHAYNLRLLSDRQGVDQIAFQYPEDAAAKAAEEKKKEEAERAAAAAAAQAEEERKRTLAAADTNKPISNTDYTVSCGRRARYLRPVLVGDNGAHTIIEFDPRLRDRDLPALQIVSPIGPGVPNSHWDPEHLRYTIDGLFDRALVKVGAGKRALVVTIDNNRKGS